MQVRELVDLARFLKTFIQDKGLVSQYEQLINAVNQAASNQNPQNVQTYLQSLRQTHADAEKQILSPAQSKLMSDYGADKLLGKLASERLEEIFATHQAHPQGLVSALQVLMSETQQLVTRTTGLIKALEPMLGEPGLAAPGEQEGRLWLYFADAASVNTIDDLEQAAETWKEVLHHFSRMPGATAEPARILQIHKYSPLELEVAASIAVLAPLAFGVSWVLSRLEHVIKICQEIERLKHLKIKTKFLKELRSEAEDQRKRITAEAADEIQKTFKATNETRNAVEQALKKIVAFVEGGGQLDIEVHEPESPEGQGDEGAAPKAPRAEIRKLVETIRKDMKLLPPRGGTGDDADEGDGEKEA